MVRNLGDAWGWAIDKIVRRIERLESGAFLESASVTAGRLRFIGGLLLLDSGARLEVVGTVDGEGQFRWVGPWEFDSPEGGTIAGDVDLAGDFDLTGKFTSGNVRIEGGRIYVGAGSNLIVIDGATGKVTVGGLVLDPSDHDGMMTLPNGAQVLGHESNLELYGPLVGGGRRGLSLRPDGVTLPGMPTETNLTGLDWVAVDFAGRLVRVPQNVGGPLGGPLDWPLPESTVTSEFGPRDGGFHEGIDFGAAEGTPIPAAASGSVVAAVTLHPGWGNYVKIDHGGGIETLYAHMVDPPLVSVGAHVSRGQTLGGVGNTGNSFGDHLHFEVHVDGVPVNPRSKLP